MKKPKIAIIGGGASATLFLAHLAKQNAKPAEITVYDRTGRFGRGIAYSTKNPSHLLNVRAVDISAMQDDAQHFVNWLAVKKKNYGPSDFVPRMIYGEYLNDVLSEASAILKTQGHDLSFKQQDISGTPKADITVLATGNDRPLAPNGAEKLSAEDGYYGDPWQADYAELSKAKHIVILGTGLSMVDAVLSLQNAGFKGKITAVSKKGLLPADHTNIRAGIPPLSAADMPRDAYGLLRFTRRLTEEARKNEIPWQAVVNSLRPVTNTLWLEIPETEQRRFLRHLMPFWIIHRHRMAPEAAATIHGLIDEGRLTIIKDTIQSVSKDLTVKGRRHTLNADCIINCLGYAVSAITPPKPPVFGLGPVLSGILFETTAIPEIRQTANKLAPEIASFLISH